MKKIDAIRINTAAGAVELRNEPTYTFRSADNAIKYRFERNFTESQRPSSIHGVVIDGDPLVIFGAGGAASGVHECSLAYTPNVLYVAVGDSVACLEPKPFLFRWVLKTDPAACFGVHFEEQNRAFISHGELSIVRFSAEGGILWRATGADIFTGNFSLKPDFIEAVDWSDRVYRFSYLDGKLARFV
jgi:hypothetical protein